MMYLILGEIIVLLGLLWGKHELLKSHKEIVKLTSSEFTSYVVFTVAIVILVLTWPFWVVRSLLQYADNSKAS